MPIARETLERALAEVNAQRPADQAVRVARFTPQGFDLSFANVTLAEGSCIDEHFVEIQFALSVREKIDTGIVGAKLDEDENRYVVSYAVIEWDDPPREAGSSQR